jgi:hypothetical protein
MNDQREGGERRSYSEIMPLLIEMREDQLKIKKILLGNGERGICEIVRTHEDVIECMKKEDLIDKVKAHDEVISDVKDIKKYLIRSFIGIGFAVITTITIAAFMGLINNKHTNSIVVEQKK